MKNEKATEVVAKDANATSTVEVQDPVDELSHILKRFLVQLDALVDTVLRVMGTLIENERKAKKAQAAAFEKLQILAAAKDVDAFWVEHRKFEKIRDARIKAMEARRMFPHSFLVSMVSQFDAFFSRAARTLFLLRPEKIRSGDRSITVSELIRHKTIEDVLLEIVNDEVDEVLRGSHIDHLEWISKKFDFKIDLKMPLVERFIEITERRNICVHADGRVSKQYVDRCKNIDQALTAQKPVGEWVPLSSSYLKTARDVLFEVGFRVVQTAWRKSRPDQKEAQARMLKDTGFDLLKSEDYDLAKNLYTFALEIRDLSDGDRKLLAINSSIAHKFSGSDTEAIKLLDSIDWSGSDLKFKMAVAILKDDYERAVSLMKSVPSEGDLGIDADEYRSWPLFKAIRNDPGFLIEFENKFNEPLQGEIKEVMETESQLAEVAVLADKSYANNEELPAASAEAIIG